MGGLKEIRIRIASVRSTRKITSAMKMVSAAKFHKAQERVGRYNAFVEKFRHVVACVPIPEGGTAHPLLRAADPKAPALLIAVGSNSAMCGKFNNTIVELTRTEYNRLKDLGMSVRLHAYGKRVADSLERHGFTLEVRDEELVDNPSFAGIEGVFSSLATELERGTLSSVTVVYNIFRNAAVQYAMATPLLPLTDTSPVPEGEQVEGVYHVEPSTEEFHSAILPQFARLRLLGFFLDNQIGEHGARMTAMTQATDNAEKLLEQLTLDYNKARQADITNELVEIVSGANALRNA